MTMSKYVPSSSLGFFVTVSSVSPLAFRLPVQEESNILYNIRVDKFLCIVS